MTKLKIKKVRKINPRYADMQINEWEWKVDETMSGETMALSDINKINNKLKFLYWKNRFLTQALRRLLCNTLIQPHFD